MVSLSPLRIPVIGIGSFSLGPTQPVTLSPACLSDALPVIVPSLVEIVTLQAPVTSAARAGATNSANNNTPSSPSRSSMRAPPWGVVRKPSGKVHKISQRGSDHRDCYRVAWLANNRRHAQIPKGRPKTFLQRIVLWAL